MSADNAEADESQGGINNPKKRVFGVPFKKGNPGGPGRPKGARSIFSDAFYKDIAKVWQEQGIQAMRKVAVEDPATFIRVGASLLPKQVQAEIDDLRTLRVSLIGAGNDLLDDDDDVDRSSGGVMRSDHRVLEGEATEIVQIEDSPDDETTDLPQMPEMSGVRSND